MNYNDWVGSIGVGIILLAYLLQTIHVISSNSKLFFLLNFFGAALACYASWLIHYWPFIFLEGTWTAVSLYGLVKARS